MKKSLWKKRLISILTVFALVAAIMLYTKVTINAEVNETKVIVTKIDIPPRTLITEDMLTIHSVPSRAVPLNAILKEDEIIGKWTVSGYGIPKNSFVYQDKIVEQSELPDAGLLELNEDEIAIPLLVDLETSLGNSIIPDSHIDLYFRTVIFEESNPKALYGKLASHIRVVSVKDSQASNVFTEEGYENNQQKHDATKAKSQTMAKIYIFAVPKELGDLINKAKMLGEVVPIATGLTYKTDLETTTDENEVVKYIQNATFVPTEEANESETTEGE